MASTTAAVATVKKDDPPPETKKEESEEESDEDMGMGKLSTLTNVCTYSFLLQQDCLIKELKRTSRDRFCSFFLNNKKKYFSLNH